MNGDARDSLLEPFPNRDLPLDASRALAMKRAIAGSRGLSSKEKALLLVVLLHTEGRTHVCYRDRQFLLAAAGGISPRRGRIILERAERIGILERIKLVSHHPRFRPGTLEWIVGAFFLRWLTVDAADIERRLGTDPLPRRVSMPGEELH